MIHDPAFDVLLPFLQQQNGKTLWIVDENALYAVSMVMPHKNLYLLTNRFDVFSAAKMAGHQVEFSDFVFSAYGHDFFHRVVYRISKEKPVVNHVLNNVMPLLQSDGTFLLSGLKKEGARNFIGKVGQLFGNLQENKSGLAYTGVFYKDIVEKVSELDDKNYSHLRLIQTPLLDFYSKPGIFGWDKIDQGSEFLLEQIAEAIKCLPDAPRSMLDLGCGYGYLTLCTRHLPLSRRVATDNNAAAVFAMKENAVHSGMVVDVLADDAGISIREEFDLILCNPPFHQGFGVDYHLLEKFLLSTRRMLSRRGAAFFVVNAFIGIEQSAAGLFSNVSVLSNNRSFKVVMLGA